jgi:hypothetical protein
MKIEPAPTSKKPMMESFSRDILFALDPPFVTLTAMARLNKLELVSSGR